MQSVCRDFYLLKLPDVCRPVQEKYGSDAGLLEELESDSTDTSEDEDGEQLTPAVDAAILRTLARIKNKDPSIYDSTKSVFEGFSVRTCL